MLFRSRVMTSYHTLQLKNSNLRKWHRAADEAELIAVRDRCTAQLAAIVHSDEEIAQAEAAFGEVTEKDVYKRQEITWASGATSTSASRATP